jgi:hypothetical protein
MKKLLTLLVFSFCVSISLSAVEPSSAALSLAGDNVMSPTGIKQSVATLPTVEGRCMLDKITAYMKLNHLEADSLPVFQKAFKEMKSRGATLLILDLQDCDGNDIAAGNRLGLLLTGLQNVITKPGKIAAQQRIQHLKQVVPPLDRIALLIGGGQTTAGVAQLVGALRHHRLAITMGDTIRVDDKVALIADVSPDQDIPYSNDWYHQVEKSGIPEHVATDYLTAHRDSLLRRYQTGQAFLYNFDDNEALLGPLRRQTVAAGIALDNNQYMFAAAHVLLQMKALVAKVLYPAEPDIADRILVSRNLTVRQAQEILRSADYTRLLSGASR